MSKPRNIGPPLANVSKTKFRTSFFIHFTAIINLNLSLSQFTALMKKYLTTRHIIHAKIDTIKPRNKKLYIQEVEFE